VADATAVTATRVAPGARLRGVTAKEKVLERAPGWTEAQATAALAVVESQARLEAFFAAEARMSDEEIRAREVRRAEVNAGDLLREETW
jgi:hypothetical protein